jgi:hypothetical protein
MLTLPKANSFAPPGNVMEMFQRVFSVSVSGWNPRANPGRTGV